MTKVVDAVDQMTAALLGTTYLGEVQRFDSPHMTATVHTLEPDSSQITEIVHDQSEGDSEASAFYLLPEVFDFLQPGESDIFSSQAG